MVVNALTVVLDQGTAEEDSARIEDAIRQLRGVNDVYRDPTSDIAVLLAESRVRADLTDKLWNVLHGVKK